MAFYNVIEAIEVNGAILNAGEVVELTDDVAAGFVIDGKLQTATPVEEADQSNDVSEASAPVDPTPVAGEVDPSAPVNEGTDPQAVIETPLDEYAASHASQPEADLPPTPPAVTETESSDAAPAQKSWMGNHTV